MNYNKTTQLGAMILLGVVLIGTFVLAWHGTITSTEAMTLVTLIVTALLAIFGVHSGVQAGSQASAKRGKES